MYAGKITLISTERDISVHNQGSGLPQPAMWQ